MESEHTRIDVGVKLRGDAIGSWHRATLVGAADSGGSAPEARVLTLRILREAAPPDTGEAGSPAAARSAQEHARLLFAEEVRRIARLDHPALLKVHRVDLKSPRPLMLTDSIEGPDLRAHIDGRGALSQAEALGLARHVLSAFRYLEARKQIHAAPVPNRIVRVGPDWRLLTFRDVRAWDELKGLKGKAHGAPAFQPPEQLRSHPESLRPLPFLAWSLGALLRFGAGGGAPCAPDGSALPLPASSPAALAPMLEGLLARDPRARPSGLTTLESVLRGEAATTRGEDPAKGPAIKAPIPRKRRPRA